MDRRKFIAAAGSVAAFAPASQAYARFGGGAFLDHAVPGVGLTVSGSLSELRLHFDLRLVQCSGHSLHRGCDSGEQAGQRPFRPADCHRQARPCSTTRHLYGELPYGLGQ